MVRWSCQVHIYPLLPFGFLTNDASMDETQLGRASQSENKRTQIIFHQDSCKGEAKCFVLDLQRTVRKALSLPQMTVILSCLTPNMFIVYTPNVILGFPFFTTTTISTCEDLVSPSNTEPNMMPGMKARPRVLVPSPLFS